MVRTRAAYRQESSGQDVPITLQGTDLGQKLLLDSGAPRGHSCPIANKLCSLHRMLSDRAIGMRGRTEGLGRVCGGLSRGERVRTLAAFRPNRGLRLVDAMESRAYTCEHSADGALLIVGFQDRRVRVYDTQTWRLVRDIRVPDLCWTVTDTATTPDRRLLALSTISSELQLVQLGRTEPPGAERRTAAGADAQHGVGEGYDSLCVARNAAEHDALGVWSVAASADGRTLAVGANDGSARILDIERRSLTQLARLHADDVNAVAFADASGQLLFTASDDRLLKLWDARAHSCAAGVLPGHTDGLTSVAARADGRLAATNGKDQTLRLWDVRKMLSAREHAALPHVPRAYAWDYRWQEWPGGAEPSAARHPHDVSLLRCCGHRVLETLVRCAFSPEPTTAQRYVYTGSQDGVIHVYDVLDGRAVDTLHFHRAPVRACSWHPHEMQLLSCSFDGTVAEWSHAHEGGGLTRAYRERMVRRMGLEVEPTGECSRDGPRVRIGRAEGARAEASSGGDAGATAAADDGACERDGGSRSGGGTSAMDVDRC